MAAKQQYRMLCERCETNTQQLKKIIACKRMKIKYEKNIKNATKDNTNENYVPQRKSRKSQTKGKL